ncbi:MAG: hypothetical protein ACI8ZB_001541 [Desulforhopalus sp.]|jgi:hypothetical protein
MILSELPFHDKMHVVGFVAGTALLCSDFASMVHKETQLISPRP